MEVSLTPISDCEVGLKFANQAEARAFLADAAPAQEAVRAQLASVHANGNGHELDAVGMPKLTRKPRAAPANSGKRTGAGKVGGATREKRPLGRKPTAASGSAYEKVPCQSCEQPIARSRMERHMKTQHYSEWLAGQGSSSSE